MCSQQQGRTVCLRALVPRSSNQRRAADVTRAPLVRAADRSQDDRTDRQTLDKLSLTLVSARSVFQMFVSFMLEAGAGGFG